MVEEIEAERAEVEECGNEAPILLAVSMRYIRRKGKALMNVPDYV